MINFYLSKNLKKTEEFWCNTLGLSVYMRQPNAIIFQGDEGQIGFLDSPHATPPNYSCISFTFESREEIDTLYQQHQSIALAPPKEHPLSPVYSFFMLDPNGLRVEFQVFI